MEVLEKAIQLIEQGQIDEAMAILDELSITESDEIKFTISTVFFEFGFYEKAETILTDLLEKYPNDGQVIIQLVDIYIELKRDDEAIRLLNEIEEKDEFYLHALLQLADLYQSQGLFEVAEEKLLTAKKIAPDELVIDFALAEFLFSVGQEGRAIPFYENVAMSSETFNDVSIIDRLAESYGSVGSYEVAMEYYRKKEPEDADGLFKYGYIARQQKEDELAISVWEKLIALDPDYFSVYPEIAHIFMEAGNNDEAFRYVKLGLKQDEFNKDLYLLAAKLSKKLHLDEDVLYYIQEALHLDEEDKAAILFLIRWYEEHENFSASIDFIEYLGDKGIRDPIYDWELAKAYIANEQYDEANQAYKTAYKSLQHDAEFLKEFGYFLVEEGQIQQAINVLNQYLTIEKTDIDTIQFTERLKDSNSF